MPEYRWSPEDAAGAEMPSPERFATSEDAERWLAERWAALRAEGATHVSLLADGEVVYRMSLEEA